MIDLITEVFNGNKTINTLRHYLGKMVKYNLFKKKKNDFLTMEHFQPSLETKQ
jgi:hypothetical protein